MVTSTSSERINQVSRYENFQIEFVILIDRIYSSNKGEFIVFILKDLYSFYNVSEKLKKKNNQLTFKYFCYI